MATVVEQQASIPGVVKKFVITSLAAIATKNSCALTFDGTYTGLIPKFVMIMPRGTGAGSITYDPSTLTYFNIDLYATSGVTACDLYVG